MSIHKIKEIISYVPEALEFTKKAFVEREFSTDNKDSTIMSALEMQYQEHIEGWRVSDVIAERVKKASALYSVGETITELSNLMLSRINEKKASYFEVSEEVKTAEEVISAMTCGLMNIEKIASRSEALYDEYQESITSDTVKLYAGAGTLNKEAAELALAVRYKRTGNEGFMKVARVIHNSDPSRLNAEDNRALAHAVIELEKEASLHGYNFYKDAFMVKEASVNNYKTVKVAGREVSISKIIAVAPSISNIIGNDVADALSEGGPEEVKAVIESLPLDLQNIIARYA